MVFCTSRFYQQLGRGEDKRKLTCGFAFRTKTMFEEEKNCFFLQAVLTMCWRSLCQISLKHGPVVSWRKANIGAWQLAGEKDMPEKANISAMFHPNSWTSMKNSPKQIYATPEVFGTLHFHQILYPFFSRALQGWGCCLFPDTTWILWLQNLCS